MTQEDKKLLLKDLCTRLPYGVKFACNKNIYTVKGLDLIVTDEGDWEYAVIAKGIAPIEIEYIKPHLRPMSSMTEDEEYEYDNLITYECNDEEGICFSINNFDKLLDWFNKNMFDYRGLIEKGLAIDATGLNIY